MWRRLPRNTVRKQDTSSSTWSTYNNLRLSLKSEQALKRSERTAKRFEEYDWVTISQDGALKHLFVDELDKYLTHFRLPLAGKKTKKIKRIQLHALGLSEKAYDRSQCSDSESDSESEYEESCTDSSDEESEFLISEIPVDDVDEHDEKFNSKSDQENKSDTELLTESDHLWKIFNL